MARDKLQFDMELAGMTDENGAIARHLLPGRLMHPCHVEVQDGMLRWYADRNWKELLPRYIRAEGPILDQFARLTAQKPDGIVRFAKQWGVFRRHEHRTEEEGPDGVFHPEQGKEPLAMWGAIASQARAILRIAANLHNRTQTAPEDWEVALTRGIIRADAAETLARRTNDPCFCHRWFEQDTLEDIVHGWLDSADVRPRLRWPANQPAEVTLQGQGLGGVLAVQLLAAVSKAEGIELCSFCGGPYTPERRPRQGERHYCPTCRNEKIPQRDAARALRQRKKRQAIGLREM